MCGALFANPLSIAPSWTETGFLTQNTHYFSYANNNMRDHYIYPHWNLPWRGLQLAHSLSSWMWRRSSSDSGSKCKLGLLDDSFISAALPTQRPLSGLFISRLASASFTVNAEGRAAEQDPSE